MATRGVWKLVRASFWLNSGLSVYGASLNSLRYAFRGRRAYRLSWCCGVRGMRGLMATRELDQRQGHNHKSRIIVQTQEQEQSDKLIWEGYKRNHKGAFPPKKTRLRCRRGEKICGNPCCICRDNIELHFTNVEILEQFICPHTGQILEATKTGLCRLQQKQLVAAIEKAWDHGLLPFTVPRKFPEEDFRIPPWNRIDIT